MRRRPLPASGGDRVARAGRFLRYLRSRPLGVNPFRPVCQGEPGMLWEQYIGSLIEAKEAGMKMACIMAIGLAALLLLGCASASKLNSVSLGMTRDQVVGAIGEPSSTSEMGNTQYLKYQLFSDWIFTDRYYVRLTDGKVDAFGRVGDFNLGY